MKKFAIVLFSLIFLIVPVFAAESGTAGSVTTVAYEYSNGILTLSGNGEINDYKWNSPAPWDSYKKDITTVNIGKGVTRIGREAFSGLTALTVLELPEGLIEIGQRAFEGCSSLKEIKIPSSVKVIENFAFSRCAVTSVELPEKLETLGAGAFDSCTRLTKVTLPNGIEEILDGTFDGCSRLSEINFPSSLKKIGNSAFSQAKFTEISLPDSITEIGDGAFDYCTKLTTVKLPANLNRIGKGAFRGCTELLSVNLPEKLESIGIAAFDGCEKLTEIEIPNTVTELGGAFSGCKNLKSAKLPDSITVIDSSMFSGCHSLTEINIPNGVTEIGAYAFSYCYSLTSVTIPESVTKMDFCVFQGCKNLKTVYLGGVKEIGTHAFAKCISLEAVPTGKSLEVIGDYAFEECDGLVDIVIPNGVKNIGEHAFWRCDSLKRVAVPESVNTLKSGAFSHCPVLESITVPSTVTSVGDGIVFECPQNVVIYCDEGSAIEEYAIKGGIKYVYIKDLSTITMQIGKQIATVYGKKVANDVAPIIRNDRTMLPARFVAEALGATVKWNAEERKVIILTEDIMIVMYIDSEYAYINGEQIALDSPAFIENDRTYTPVRFIAEALGATVEWDGETSTVTITKGEIVEGFSYKTADMSKYVKLGKYTGFSFEYTEPGEITEQDVEDYILMEIGGAVQLTDEFAKEKLGFETAESYRDYVREGLRKQRELTIITEKSALVLEKVFENSEIIEYPEGLLEEKITDRMELMTIVINAYQLTLEDYLELAGMSKEEFEESVRAEAETEFREEFITMAIAKAEGLYATKEECDAMMHNDLMKAYNCSSTEELCEFYMIPEKVLYEMYELTVTKHNGMKFLAENSVFEE